MDSAEPLKSKVSKLSAPPTVLPTSPDYHKFLRMPCPADRLLHEAFKPQWARYTKLPEDYLQMLKISFGNHSCSISCARDFPPEEYISMHIKLLCALNSAINTPKSRPEHRASAHHRVDPGPVTDWYYESGPVPIVGTVPTYEYPSPLALAMQGIDFATVGTCPEPTAPMGQLLEEFIERQVAYEYDWDGQAVDEAECERLIEEEDGGGGVWRKYEKRLVFPTVAGRSLITEGVKEIRERESKVLLGEGKESE